MMSYVAVPCCWHALFLFIGVASCPFNVYIICHELVICHCCAEYTMYYTELGVRNKIK